ncbi:MAG TPA: DUF2726 domain-containing protein [Burkholderiaceae bacterium]|nr:DUF2726 domain-containing protein [Burkholderiaceae bacterium]
MTALQIALGVLALGLLVAWWALRRRGSADAADRGRADRLDTITGWPPQSTRILSTQERVAYGTLVRALPEYMILAQVPLSRFINVPRRNSYADWLRRIGNQCADFVVCNMASQVVAVVEVQPPQPGDRQRKRLLRIQRTLKAAKIPLLIWGESAIPSADTARAQILPPEDPTATATVPGAAPAGALPLVPEAAAAAVPDPGPNPFDELDRDSTQDELIELLEPPPSTWYDELDSGPTPLKKR